MKNIGLDAHSTTFTTAVQTAAGKLATVTKRETTEENLIEVVHSVRGPKRLIVEESHLAQWIKVALEPYVDELIVCDPKHNRWISKDDFADDRSSAIKLAELARLGGLKPVYHPDEDMGALRSLFLHYRDLTEEQTRCKNKLKATFRRIGIRTSGRDIYRPESREQWVELLHQHPHLRLQAEHFFTLVETAGLMKDRTHQQMTRRSRKLAVYPRLLAVPGVGPVVATGYLALIVTPHRFSGKHKLWRYAGLGNQQHMSDGRVYSDRPSRSGNRALKWVVMQHFQGAVQRAKKPNRFRLQFQRLQARGLPEKDARRTVCRSLLSTVHAMWLSGEEYQETHCPQHS